jgi:acyl-CoA thioesterase-1
VLFLGTSLTAGLGVAQSEAFPAVIQSLLDSSEIPLRAVNAGVSGETSAGGLRRLEPLLRLPLAVLVVELGANDGLRGLDVGAMRDNLQSIIDRTRGVHPSVRVVIAGMQAPPNLGARYTTEFREAFAMVARDNDAALVPFLLEGVGGHPDLNQADGIHPTPEGHRVLAANVWTVLGDVAAEAAARATTQ